MGYEASTHLLLRRTLYRWFGPPVGAMLELGAVLASIVLAILVRERRPAFWLAAAAAGGIVAAHVIWWLWVNPANAAMAAMPLEASPADWQEWRDPSEYTHLARFVLQAFGLVAVTLSVVVETPRDFGEGGHGAARIR